MPSDVDVYSKSWPVVRPVDLVHCRPFFLPQTTLSKSSIYSAVSTCTLRSWCIVFFVMLMGPCRRWEFFTTLDFEWEVFTGRRPWKWSFAVYLTSRILALMAIMCNFIGFSLTTEFSCNVSDHSGVLLAGTDEPESYAGLVPLYPCCGMVLCGYRLVSSCATWASDPWSRLFPRRL
jgi:hypothetical protein